MPNHSDTLSEGSIKSHQTLSTTYKTDASDNQNVRLIMKNSMMLTYDSANKVSSVYGYIPSLASYPVLIIAKPGNDVFVDILGLPSP